MNFTKLERLYSYFLKKIKIKILIFYIFFIQVKTKESTKIAMLGLKAIPRISHRTSSATSQRVVRKSQYWRPSTVKFS